jgi:hypothetical protein
MSLTTFSGCSALSALAKHQLSKEVLVVDEIFIFACVLLAFYLRRFELLRLHLPRHLRVAFTAA